MRTFALLLAAALVLGGCGMDTLRAVGVAVELGSLIDDGLTGKGETEPPPNPAGNEAP